MISEASFVSFQSDEQKTSSMRKIFDAGSDIICFQFSCFGLISQRNGKEKGRQSEVIEFTLHCGKFRLPS